MIILAVALLVSSNSEEGLCVAWRDPDTGKVVSALDLAGRANKTQQRVFNTEATDRSLIEKARKLPECAVRKTKARPKH